MIGEKKQHKKAMYSYIRLAPWSCDRFQTSTLSRSVIRLWFEITCRLLPLSLNTNSADSNHPSHGSQPEEIKHCIRYSHPPRFHGAQGSQQSTLSRTRFLGGVDHRCLGVRVQGQRRGGVSRPRSECRHSLCNSV